MTDYLEELLEQREEESEGSLPEWRRVRIPDAGAREGAAPGQTDMQTAAAYVTEAAQKREQELGPARLLQQVRRLHRAVRQAGERERGKSATVLPAAAVWESAGRYSTVSSSRGTADYAAAVDRAFQRDARRYDGPMELPR